MTKLGKKELYMLAKGLMAELYKIQQSWNAWEKAIADLCNKTRDSSDSNDGNTR